MKYEHVRAAVVGNAEFVGAGGGDFDDDGDDAVVVEVDGVSSDGVADLRLASLLSRNRTLYPKRMKNMMTTSRNRTLLNS